MSSANDKTKLILQGATNYTLWVQEVKSSLQRKGVWRVTAGTALCPIQTETGSVDEATSSKIEAWCEKDELAKGVIFSSVAAHIYSDVKDKPTSQEVWDHLSCFSRLSLNQRAQLYAKLFGLKFDGNGSLGRHIATLKEIRTMLGEQNMDVEETVFNCAIIQSLPSSYAGIVDAIGASEKGFEISSSDLEMKLIEKETHLKASNSTRTANETHRVNVVKEKRFKRFRCGNCGSGEHKTNDCKSDVKCFKCNEFGHISRNCTKEKANLAMKEKANKEKEYWYLDSGATVHISSNQDIFYKLDCAKSFSVGLAKENEEMKAIGTGSVEVLCEGREVCLNDVAYCPDAEFNLLSVSKLLEKGIGVVFDARSKRAYLEKNGKVMTWLIKRGGLFAVKFDFVKMQANAALSTVKITMEVAHNRLGHINSRTIQRLSKDNLMNNLILENEPFDSSECKVCIQNKATKMSLNPVKTWESAKEIGEKIHCDIKELPQAIHGMKYNISFLDEYSQYCCTYQTSRKDEAIARFRDCVYPWFKTQTGKSIKILVCDKAKEFISGENRKFCDSMGIEIHCSPEYRPEMNGKIERYNRTLSELANCLLHHANLPNYFWPFAYESANFILNRSISRVSCTGKTPYENIYKVPPDFKHFRTFGCVAYVHVPDQLRSSLDNRSIKCIFIGYNAKSWKFMEVDTRKIINSVDAKFFENQFEKFPDFEDENVEDDAKSSDYILSSSSCDDSDNDHADFQKLRSTGVEDVRHKDITENFQVNPPEMREQVRRSARIQEKQSRNERGNLAMQDKKFNSKLQVFSAAVYPKIPKNYTEAISQRDSDFWIKAVQKEIQSLESKGTWKIVQRPPKEKIIPHKWVFTVKESQESGDIVGKARLVACGNHQTEGIHYTDTFSPTLRGDSLRLLLAISAQFDLRIFHVDINSAYVQSDLDIPVYLSMPKCIPCEPGNVLLLKKSIYGLKQSGRNWNKKLVNVMSLLGFVQCKSDPCVFQVNQDGIKLLVGIYVDDLVLLGPADSHLISLFKEISSHLDCKLVSSGPVYHIAGIQVNSESGRVCIHQKDYIQEKLEEFALENSKSVDVPATTIPLSVIMKPKTEQEVHEMNEVPYRSAVGSLMYASCQSRPDITFAVHQSARFFDNPGKQHWIAVKRIFKYLRKTSDLGLVYRKQSVPLLYGYVDASYASCPDTLKSTSGYIFFFAGAAVSWNSKRQTSVANSTLASEYIAASAAAVEGLWALNLLQELNLYEQTNIPLYEDNTACIRLAKFDETTTKAKHLNIKYHFIRDQVQTGKVSLLYKSTEEMIADALTKPLPRTKFEYLRAQMGILPLVFN
jgi:hypothetical protein